MVCIKCHTCIFDLPHVPHCVPMESPEHGRRGSISLLSSVVHHLFQLIIQQGIRVHGLNGGALKPVYLPDLGQLAPAHLRHDIEEGVLYSLAFSWCKGAEDKQLVQCILEIVLQRFHLNRFFLQPSGFSSGLRPTATLACPHKKQGQIALWQSMPVRNVVVGLRLFLPSAGTPHFTPRPARCRILTRRAKPPRPFAPCR